MLDGPPLVGVAQEDVCVGLCGSQREADVVCGHGGDGGAEDHRPAAVGFGAVVVGVEDDDVAHAEVGDVVVGGVAEAEQHAVHAPLVARLRFHEGEVGVDVARHELLGQRLPPLGREACVGSLARAHLGAQVLGGEEGLEAQAVGPLQR